MSTTVLYMICLTYGLFNLCTVCLLIVLENLHDIRDYQDKRVAKFPVVDQTSAPHIKFSIIVPAHNEAAVIRRCLNSLVALDYKNFQVIIMNDGSRDDTDAIIRGALINIEHTEQAISKHIRFLYVHTTKNSGKARALNDALVYANGDVIVCMDADAVFKTDALSRAAVYFYDKTVSVVAVNNKLIIRDRWLDILQQYDFISNYRSKKAYDLLQAEYIVSGIGAMYRKQTIDAIGGIPGNTMTEDIDTSLHVALLGNKTHRIVYAEDIITYMEPVHSFGDLLKQRFRWKFGNLQSMYKSRHRLFNAKTDLSRSLRWWRFPMAIWAEFSMLIELAFMVIMVYLSLFLGNGLFILVSYVVATSLSACTILADETETAVAKRKLLRFLPIMYLLSLVMNVVQLYASLKSIASLRQLRHPKRNYTWLSPMRQGASLDIEE